MHFAFGVFANAKIQCEESVSSSTPLNCSIIDYSARSLRLEVALTTCVKLYYSLDNSDCVQPVA